MKALFLNCESFSFEPYKKVIPEAEEPESLSLKDVLVVFLCIEKGDDERNVEELLNEIERVSSEIGTKRILLYPYAHLSKKLENPKRALEIFRKAYEKCKEKFECYKAPFGWLKRFEMKLKDFESYREIKKAKRKVEKEYLIIDGEDEKSVEAYKEYNEEFRILVEKEALGKELEGGEPKLLEILKRFGFEWEEYSDFGHMRFSPKAALMYDLAIEYHKKLMKKIEKRINVPIFFVKGTNMFNLDVEPIKKHAELFGERMYEVESDKGILVLRYAACFQQFSLAKDWIISYKQVPFGMFEIADSYRFEQRGEVELLFRVRKLTVPDLHIFCRDLEEARRIFIEMHKIIMEEMEEKIGRRYEILANFSSRENYEKFKDLAKEMSKISKRPILCCIYKGKGDYYWTINVEYHIIDYLKRPREVGTIQIDVGNSERFGIKYYDENAKAKYPVILHIAVLGSIERYLYTILDKALREKKLPLWISPSQVRIIPVSEKYVEFAEEVAKKIEEKGFRVEIDDRNLTVERRIRDAELDWVNYTIVVGEREKNTGDLPIRIRGENKIVKMKIDEFVKMLEEEQKNYPKMPIYWSKYISKNPF